MRSTYCRIITVLYEVLKLYCCMSRSCCYYTVRIAYLFNQHYKIKRSSRHNIWSAISSYTTFISWPFLEYDRMYRNSSTYVRLLHPVLSWKALLSCRQIIKMSKRMSLTEYQLQYNVFVHWGYIATFFKCRVLLQTTINCGIIIPIGCHYS